MQSKKKGFTLIELLAVIVILAIIALIAVPVIMNVIGNARKSAFEDSAYGIVKAGEIYYTNELLENGGMTSDKEFTITNGAFVGENKLEVSGSLPKSGKIKVTKEGKVAVALSNGEYCVRKATTESLLKAESLEDLGGVCNYKTAFTTATDGTEVPTCITNNTPCNVSVAGDDGIKVGVKVNNSEIKDFYVISEDASEGTITLIMNENLGSDVAWISEETYKSAGGTRTGLFEKNDKGPLTAINELAKRTKDWNNIMEFNYTYTDENVPKEYEDIKKTDIRARLLTRTEAMNLGCALDGSTGTCASWLGGDFWLSSVKVGLSGDAVYSNGYMDGFAGGSTYSTGLGLRPVITISKTVL